MGLELLKSFIKTNQGKLECYSHEGYTLIRDNEVYENLTAFFKGTLVIFPQGVKLLYVRTSPENWTHNFLTILLKERDIA